MKLHDALATRGDVRVVRRDHEREAELLAQRVDQVEHARGGVGVEVAGRLVAQQHVGLLRERPRDRGALRLAAGELARQVVELVLQADEAEQLLRVRAVALCEEHVLERGEVGEQVRALEDERRRRVALDGARA